MSDDLSAIHAQASAIFEKLYAENGQPAELDDTFIQQYFTLVQEHLQPEADQDEVDGKNPLIPVKAEAKLSQQDKGLVDVFIPSKKEKFVVSKLQSVKTLSGYSQRMYKDRGKGIYTMITLQGFPSIWISCGKATISFVGSTSIKVQSEDGDGEWEKV